MPCEFVIHAVGPVWHGGKQGERDLLKGAITSTLKRAIELSPQLKDSKNRRVLIPAISSAIFGYPIEKCAKVFGETIFNFIDQMSEEDKALLPEIILCNIEPDTINALEEQLANQYEIRMKQ